MFFGLDAVDDHPCCKMQEAVEAFFSNSVESDAFSLDLFPVWIQPTLKKESCALGKKFSAVHSLLHVDGMTRDNRQAIYEQLELTNQIQGLCDGAALVPHNVIDWGEDLGIAITALMSTLYESLDLAVFRRVGGKLEKPTHQLYSEFIEKNRYVCPFCGLDKFKNKKGARREDFDHYLHESGYVLAAANMKNLVPTCGTCNQDYKKAKNILADGKAFYPYAAVPEVKVEIDCSAYPAPENFKDSGNWIVKLDLVVPDAAVAPKLKAWNRVYSIKNRIESEIREFFEEWMKEVSDNYPHPLDHHEFVGLITTARDKARDRSKRRMEPGQIVRAAFYDFMITKAEHSFLESFRKLQNHSCA